MSVRRPLWVRRLAFVIFELTDPAGAAQVRMSRGALVSPEGSRTGRSPGASSGDTSALSGEDKRHELPWRLVSGPPSDGLGPSSPLSASDHAAEPAWHPPTPSGGPAVRLVPGLGGRAQLLLFAAIFFGPAIGWALAVIFGVEL